MHAHTQMYTQVHTHAHTHTHTQVIYIHMFSNTLVLHLFKNLRHPFLYVLEYFAVNVHKVYSQRTFSINI